MRHGSLREAKDGAGVKYSDYALILSGVTFEAPASSLPYGGGGGRGSE